MKRLTLPLLTVLMLLGMPAFCQSDEQVFDVVETMPSFPGGQQALFHYIAENILYPKDALEQGIEGRPICKFVVNKDSTISDVVLVRSCGTPSLDDEAIRVIGDMPKWNPGIQNGQIVRARYTLPIPFRLSPAVKANIGEIYEEVDRQPQFPADSAALRKFLRDNIMWPAIARENNIRGTAVCAFVVNKLGEITDPQIKVSAGDPSLDKEALRVLRAMPRWTPGVKNEQPVRVRTEMHISVPYSDEIIGSYSDTTIFVLVEKMPEFPGGQQALFNFLKENVHYPEDARKAKIEGRVLCQFIVNSDGRIVDVHVVKSSGNASLDHEALRVIHKMPRWKPGIQKGKPVRVKYTVPINFKL
ncbi:MAG: energy transducer TonB [Paludibacteraceae bacterium]|nr:energy transducer TonB [Paludibacteraceae bacterium]